MRLIIVGNNVTNDADGLQELKINYVLNPADRTVGYSASSTIRLVGAAAEIVRPVITDLSLALSAEIITDDITMDFVVSAKNARDCGCDVEIALQSNLEDRVKYEILSKNIISDGDFFNGINATGGVKRIPYCHEANLLTYIMIWLYLALLPVIAIVAAIGGLFYDGLRFNQIGDWVKGCYKYHFIFNIRKTCRHWIEQAGLKFSSSLIPEDWYFLDGYGNEGLERRRAAQQNVNDAEYLINLTVPQFLEQLAQVQNADFRIINGVMVYERKDHFANIAPIITGEILDSFCIEPDPEQLVGSLRFDWASDAGDTASQMATPFYGGREDLNPSEWPSLVGSRNVNPRFAVTRFIGDKWGNAFVRLIRQSTIIGRRHVNDAVIAFGQTAEMRLFNIKHQSGLYSFTDRVGEENGRRIYNAPFFFKPFTRLNNTTTGDLYSTYFDIDDPKKYPRFFANEIRIKPDNVCDLVDLLNARSLNVAINTDYGKALPTEIEYTPKNGIFVFRNNTIWP
jgi:hypothetical protein